MSPIICHLSTTPTATATTLSNANQQIKKAFLSFTKGLQRQRLIGSAVAGFIHAKTITKASATDLHARQDDYNKGM